MRYLWKLSKPQSASACALPEQTTQKSIEKTGVNGKPSLWRRVCIPANTNNKFTFLIYIHAWVVLKYALYEVIHSKKHPAPTRIHIEPIIYGLS